MSGWKPGDVAMVTARWIRTDDHSERYAVRRPSGWWSRSSVNVGDHEVSNIRPLVVIDPEEWSRVGLLAQAFIAAWGGCEGGAEGAMHTALNTLLAPPKPNEPTGLGAVVEDAEGQTWIRGWKETWHRPNLTAKWAAVSAVRVLSEGVTP